METCHDYACLGFLRLDYLFLILRSVYAISAFLMASWPYPCLSVAERHSLDAFLNLTSLTFASQTFLLLDKNKHVRFALAFRKDVVARHSSKLSLLSTSARLFPLRLFIDVSFIYYIFSMTNCWSHPSTVEALTIVFVILILLFWIVVALNCAIRWWSNCKHVCRINSKQSNQSTSLECFFSVGYKW